MALSIIKAPIRPGVGGCIDCGWRLSTACGYDLVKLTLGAFSSANIAVTFLGSGKIDMGGSCPGSSAYVSNGGGAFITVAVWDAYIAGAWTSSTTIPVYLINPFGAAETITAQSAANLNHTATKSGTPPIGSGCPSVLFGTVTVFDDGTLTFT